MKNRNAFSIVVSRRLGVLLGLLGALALSSCIPIPLSGIEKSEDATLAVYPVRGAASLASGIDAFTTIVYPLIKQSQCTTCHTAQVPTIASGSISVAYAAAKTRINLNVPELSTIIRKASDGHCQGCASAPASEWLKAVTQWVNSENAGGAGSNGSGEYGPPPPVLDITSPPVFVTSALVLDGTANVNKVAPLAARGSDFSQVDLFFSVQDPYTAVANSARIYNIRLRNNSTKYIAIRGIRLYQSVDATVNPSDPNDFKSDLGGIAFIDIDAIVYPGTTLRLSFSEALMSKAASDGLYYAFGFQALEVTTAANCKAGNIFANTVNPVLNNKCAGCHTGNGSGRTAWLFAASVSDRCIQALQRSDLVTPNASRLIQFPFYRQNSHPATGMSQPEFDSIVNWINREK